MTPDQAKRAIEEALALIAPNADADGLTPDADLRETLELDSLDFLNFVEELSKRAGQRIDEDDYPHLATMASAVSFLAAGRRSATS